MFQLSKLDVTLFAVCLLVLTAQGQFWYNDRVRRKRDGNVVTVLRHTEEGERHKKPHLHARHAGMQASFDIASGEVLAGELDGDDIAKVRAWISIHREDLFANWTLLIEQGTFFKIDPLR